MSQEKAQRILCKKKVVNKKDFISVFNGDN